MSKIKSVKICIADFPLKISCSNIHLLNRIKSRYSSFIKKYKDPSFELKIDLLEEQMEVPIEFAIKPTVKNIIDFEIKFNSEALPKFKIDLKKKIATLVTQEVSMAKIDFLIKLFYYTMFPIRDIFCIHASSLIKNNKGYIFFGPSGAGKTTICNSLKNGVVVHDDVTLIKFEKNKFKIYPHPFRKLKTKKNFKIIKRPVEVKGIFQIIQSKNNKLLETKKSEVMLPLMRQNMFRSFNHLKKQDQLINKLFKYAKIYKLEFRKKCDFWKILNEIE